MIQCPICSSINRRKLSGYEHAFLVKCRNCDLVFSERHPTDEELRNFYDSGYDLTRYFSPVTKKRYDELLEEFAAYRQNNRLLDIGAGYGFFLETALEHNWEVSGTEISASARKVCEEKGIPMHGGNLQEIGFPDNSFDVVVMIEVIEHVPNVHELILEANRILRPGGLLYVTTPNFNAINRYRLKEKYDIVQYPLHLTYFVPKTLRQIAENNGFSTLDIRTTGISRTRYKTSTGQSNQAYVSETSDDEMLRYKIEQSSFLRAMKSIANGVLNLLSIGESLKGRFIKK